MKKQLLISLLIAGLYVNIYCQTPQSFNYQAVARNNIGEILSNQNVFIRVNILKDSISGASVYSETHAISTNQFGLITLQIGNGVVLSGNINIIKWDSGSYFLKIEMDENGGLNFQIMGISQLLSVPYALHANSSEKCALKHTNTGNSSELITSLPVTTGSPYQRKIIYSQQLNDIKAGEIIEVLSEFEVTNDLGFNVMIASIIILADNPTDVTGIEITEANGYNVTPGMHHGTTIKVGTYIVTADYAIKYVNVIGYAASTAASSGNVITVEHDYGRLSVLRFP